MPNLYYVTKNGVPCKLDKSVKLHYKGLLRECEVNDLPFSGIGYQAGKLKMNRAIERTVAAARTMRESVFGDWKNINWLTTGGEFKVVKQKVDQVERALTQTLP